MTAQRMLSTYRQTEVQSRTPLELVVMLYDGGLAFLHQARAAIERNDIRPGARPRRARSPSSRSSRAR